MNELYELTKQFDVLAIFSIFMGLGIYGIVSTIMDGICFIHKAWKKHKEKKEAAKEKTEE